MDNGFYPEVGKYYDADAADFDSRYWRNPVLQQIRQSFREEVKRYPFKNILEVGCGTGIDLLHFAYIHPQAEVQGIDISEQMVSLTQLKISESNLTNVHAYIAKVEDLPLLFPDRKFDMIYVFFGALNTVDNLYNNAAILGNMLHSDGKMVLTFVNKWYIGGMVLEALRFRVRRAMARISPVWGGYSPAKYLPSKCYSPRTVKDAFYGYTMIKHQGYSIMHPAWYFTGINKRLGKLRKLLWKTDIWLNKTPFWQFGEYTLFTFQKRDRSV